MTMNIPEGSGFKVETLNSVYSFSKEVEGLRNVSYQNKENKELPFTQCAVLKVKIGEEMILFWKDEKDKLKLRITSPVQNFFVVS